MTIRVLAYCCASFAESARKAAGAEPLCSPPMSAEYFQPWWLQDRDLIYLDLHGGPGLWWWYGDDGTIALKEEQVRAADLGGAVVFALNCYLADAHSPMMDALLDAGASFVIGGDGQNWATGRRPTGAAWLGLRFRQMLERGFEPMKALAVSKRYLSLVMAAHRVLKKRSKVMADKDTLAFRAYYRRSV